MTTAYTKAGATSYNNHDAQVYSWTLASNEAGDAMIDPAYADRSVHIYGTFGAATVVWEGSNEAGAPANYVTLNDPLGNPISKSAAALVAVLEMVRQARPRVIGGDGTTNITIQFLAKR